MKRIEEYGKFEDGKFEYCPNPLKTGVGEYGEIYTANPDEETILQAGYQKIEKEEKPADKDGGTWVEDEPVEIDGKIYVSWTFVETPLTVLDYDRAMEDHLLEERNARGYTTREPTQYTTSTVERFAQDAKDWMKHVDEVMLYALSVENSYAETGKAPTLQEFKDNMPKIAWTIEK